MQLEITTAARGDLSFILAQGIKNFGHEQALAYVDGIVDLFDLLSTQPQMAPVNWVGTRAIRLKPYQGHLILYEIENDTLVIQRVLAGKQNWRKHL